MGKRAMWTVLVSFLALLNFHPELFAASSDVVPGRYIVVFKDDVADPEVESDDLKQLHRLIKGLVFSHALKGFAATIPPAKLKEILSDPRVAYVVSDRIFRTMVQSTPTGIDRVNAEVSTSSGLTGLRVDNSQPVDVAVIDTGIDLTHPDLAPNIGGSVNFLNRTRDGDDDNGHGSHVAGIVAAVHNNDGVVGVAPNARLWAVKVLNASGAGLMSTVIAGIDWVTASRTTPGREPIELANLSLGGIGFDDRNCGRLFNDPLHRAICRSVSAGVTYVVAAGNNAANANFFSPAAYPEVITVSALADSDGRPGGLGPSTPYGADDTLARFSNFGSPVDLIAPGVEIVSTYKDGGYATLSGTSMAAPHVTGAAALYIAAHPTATPAQVRGGLIAAGVLDWNTATDREARHEPRADACRATGLSVCP